MAKSWKCVGHKVWEPYRGFNQCIEPLLPGRIDFIRFKGLPKNGYQSLEETCQELCPGIVTSSCEMR